MVRRRLTVETRITGKVITKMRIVVKVIMRIAGKVRVRVRVRDKTRVRVRDKTRVRVRDKVTVRAKVGDRVIGTPPLRATVRVEIGLEIGAGSGFTYDSVRTRHHPQPETDDPTTGQNTSRNCDPNPNTKDTSTGQNVSKSCMASLRFPDSMSSPEEHAQIRSGH